MATLLYLATQMKQNNAFAKAQIYQARADATQYVSAEFGNASINAKLLGENFQTDPQKWEQLTLEEKMRMRRLAFAWDVHIDNVLKQSEPGMMDYVDIETSGGSDDLLRMVYFFHRETNQPIRTRTLRLIRERGIDADSQEL